MFVFRHGSKCAAKSFARPAVRTLRRTYASKIDIPFEKPPFPVTATCPAPTCQCREMPSGLDIEQEQNLNGSLASYAEQVLISTGKEDWTSKIEDEEDAGFLRLLKGMLGRGGKFADPYHNVMISNSSIEPTHSPLHQTDRSTQPTSAPEGVPVASPGKDPQITNQNEAKPLPPASAFLLPSFQYVPSIPCTPSAVEQFLKAFVLPSRLHQSHERLTRQEQNILKRQPELQSSFPGARKADEIIILICGHGGRDSRCGILGPILRDEFREKLQRQNVALLDEAPVAEAEIIDTDKDGYVPTARVGMVSHMGGHKWAGNVGIYIPSSWKQHPLAGKGVWYGRVDPGKVEGIVGETVLKGKVIKDLFRGGVGQEGEVLRL
ncbi:hypothetical protein MBLNU230_g5783t1 [Neophaeotheca triangularis]